MSAAALILELISPHRSVPIGMVLQKHSRQSVDTSVEEFHLHATVLGMFANLADKALKPCPFARAIHGYTENI